MECVPVYHIKGWGKFNRHYGDFCTGADTAGLMLGSDKSRGYCLEMICADFLAGVSLEAGNKDALVPCIIRLVIGLPKPQRKQLLEEVQVTF